MKKQIYPINQNIKKSDINSLIWNSNVQDYQEENLEIYNSLPENDNNPWNIDQWTLDVERPIATIQKDISSIYEIECLSVSQTSDLLSSELWCSVNTDALSGDYGLSSEIQNSLSVKIADLRECAIFEISGNTYPNTPCVPKYYNRNPYFSSLSSTPSSDTCCNVLSVYNTEPYNPSYDSMIQLSSYDVLLSSMTSSNVQYELEYLDSERPCIKIGVFWL